MEALLDLHERTGGEALPLCIECSLEAAERFCKSCDVNLCGKCFELTHGERGGEVRL